MAPPVATPPEALIAEILLGELGQTADVNALRIPPGALENADGVVCANNAVEKEPGAVVLDTIGGAPEASGTLTGSSPWAAALTTFKLTTGATVPTVIDTALGIGGGGTTLTLTVPAAGVAVGERLVVAIKTLAVPIGGHTITVTDNKGNSYPKTDVTKYVDVLWANNVHQLTVLSSRITTALLVGDTLTITFAAAPGTNQVAATAVKFTNDDGAVDRIATKLNNAGSTAVTVGPTAPLTYVPELIVYVATWTAAVTHTAGSGFTEHNEHDQLAVSSRVDATTPTILAMVDFAPLSAAAPAGTVAAVKGTQSVTGTGTSFTTVAFLGDAIELTTGGVTERRRVTAIASNTSLSVDSPWTTDFPAASPFVLIARQRVLTAVSTGVIYKERNLVFDAVSVRTGLSPSAHPGQFLLAGKEAGIASTAKAFYVNGVDPVAFLADDAAAMTVLNGATEAAADWGVAPGANQPAAGVVHAGRLWLFGNANDPHRVYGSLLGNHRDFRTTTGTDRTVQYDVHSNVGERIVAGVDFNGVLVIAKYPRGLFWFDDADFDPTRWAWRTKSEALGVVASPYAMLSIDDDVLLFTPDARIHLLSAVDTLGGLRASDLTAQLRIERWMRANVNLDRLHELVSVWDAATRTALFAVPAAGSTMNTLLLRFDFSAQAFGGAIKFAYSRRDAVGAFAVWRDLSSPYQLGSHQILQGEAGAVVLRDPLGNTDYTKSQVGYATAVRLPKSDLRFVDARIAPNIAHRRKNFIAVELVFDATVATGAAGDEAATLLVYLDDVLQGSYPVRVNRALDRVPISGNGRFIAVALSTPATALAGSGYRWLALRYVFTLGGTEIRAAATG